MTSERVIMLRDRIKANNEEVDTLNGDLLHNNLSSRGVAAIQKEISMVDSDTQRCRQELRNNGFREA